MYLPINTQKEVFLNGYCRKICLFGISHHLITTVGNVNIEKLIDFVKQRLPNAIKHTK